MRTPIFCQQPLLFFFALCLGTSGYIQAQPIPLPATLLELQHSPSPYECVVLSAHMYQEDIKEATAVSCENRKTKHYLPDWAVLTTFQCGELSRAWQQLGLPCQGQAILYRNEAKKQLVLAYKGLELSNTIKATPEMDVKQLIATQEKALTDLLTEALSITQEQQCSLTVTGHSLGGWLAQLTVFMAQQLYPETHVKAITFDSPGARPMLEYLNAGPDAIQLDYLDITNYLSTPNFINASSPHVGSVCQVVFGRFSRKPMVYNQQSHAVENCLCAFNPNTGAAYQCAFVQQWPLLPLITPARRQGSKHAETSQVIFNLLTAFQQCMQGESLKNYQGFFKLVKKASRYHSSPFEIIQQASAEATHIYTYKTRPFRRSYAHIRHIPRIARQFLIGVQRKAPANVNVAAQHPLVHALQWNRRKDFVSIPLQQDIRFVIDQLISLTAEYPTLCAPTTLLPHLVLATNSLLPPPAVSFFVGRKALQKQLLNAFVSEKPLVIAPPITGPGGIGKSQLAIWVMAQQALLHHYEHIFWISAETPEKLQDAYLCMAEDLGLYVDKKNLKKVVQDVRVHLQEKHCLYVFDDAASSEAIEGFLPLHRGHVLITSRNSNGKFWDVAPVLVAPLNEAEALELAQQYHYGNNKEEQQLFKALLAEVPSYPLFLVQLFNILADEGIRPKAFLNNLKRYEAEMKDKKLVEWLAQDPYPQVHYDRGLSMLYVFKKSLERLSKEDKGTDAIQLLSQLAYLDPKGIPLGFILTLDEKDSSLLKRKTRAVLLLLEKYSLVQWDRESKNVYIHAETQLIVRELHPKSSFQKLVGSFAQYSGKHEELQGHLKWSSLLPHGRILFIRINKPEHLRYSYTLTQYLVDACDVVGFFDEEAIWTNEHLQIAQKLYAGKNHIELAQTFSGTARTYHRLGNHEKAIDYHLKALEILKKIYPDQNNLAIARSKQYIGVFMKKMDKYEECRSYLEEALEIYASMYQQQDNRDVAYTMHHLGVVLRYFANYEDALRYLQKGFDMQKRIYQERDEVCIAYSLQQIGIVFDRLGRHKEALKYIANALEMMRRIYNGADNVRIIYFLNELGRYFNHSGDLKKALQYNELALKMSKRLYKNQDYIHVYHSFVNWGVSVSAIRRYKVGISYQKKALEISKRLLGERDHPYIAYALKGIGTDLLHLGKIAEGLLYLKSALAMYDRFYNVHPHPYVASTANEIGNALFKTNQKESALFFHKRAAMVSLTFYKKAHPSISKHIKHFLESLNDMIDERLLQQTKAEVLPLCIQYLGKNHELTQALSAVGSKKEK